MTILAKCLAMRRLLAVSLFALACKSTPSSTDPPSADGAKAIESSEMRFWAIVEAAAREAGAGDPVGPLRRRLTELPADQVLAFQREFRNQLARSYGHELWGAAYVINGGCSDDCFEYFRAWLIAQGREPFERALENPDSLAAHPHLEGPAENEEVLGVAIDVYRAKTTKEPEFKVAYPRLGEGWNFDDSAQMKQKYPKLCARFRC